MILDNLNAVVNFHSSICIDKNIYIDPLGFKSKLNNAKLVFITHPHWDHLDAESIKNVSNNQTAFICTQDSRKSLIELGIEEKNILVVSPEQKYEAFDIEFETFSAYNLKKEFHPKANAWVGYLLKINGIKYAICGDSDATPELKKIRADVLFVPIGGTYTMNALEAAELTNCVKPKIVVPMHFGEIVGDKSLIDEFAENLNVGILCINFIK